MPKIVINEFYRGGSLTAGDEFIELLLVEDVTAAQLDLFFVGDSTGAKASKFSAYDFTNTGSITSVLKAGTIITVGGTTAFTQDTSYNPAGGDWNIALNAGGSFLPNANSGNNGDIAGDDVVWVDTINTGATISADGFAADIGTVTTGAFTAAANVNFGTSTNNTGYALNSDLAGASNTANWTTGILFAATTPGQANGGANTTYINSLRTVVPPSGSTVTIAASPASITEGSTTAGLFTFTRTGDTTNALTVNFTTGGTATSGSDYLTPASFATNSIEIPAGQSSVSIAISAIDDNEVEVVENVSVTLNASANYTVGSTNAATVTINDNDAPAVTLISQIQGSGTAATAGTFTIEGIVVGDFQDAGQLGGFYLQEENTDADGSVLTSEGIFVNSLFAVNVGEKVRLTGAVQENASAPSFNQAVITPTNTQILGSGFQSLVTPTVVDLPTVALGDLERYEGMLVTFPETLTVTETFNLGRFGEVVLSANGRLFQPTNFVDPNDSPASGTNASGSSNVAAVIDQQNLNDRSRIILDDGSSNSNLSDVPYINTTDADPLNDTLRIGSTTTGLTGVLGFGFSAYRIQPTQTPTFDYAARPGVPTVGGSAKVASFNVLNYFNGDGQGSGFPTARGADTLVEFNRQRAKIIAAINELNADVVGLIEIENDGDGPNSAIADLVNGLNAVAGAGTYAFVPLANTTGNAGTDAIKVAFIYKPGAVTPVGNATYFNDSAFDTARPPLAQTFQVNATGGTFTPVINHFKSKSSAANLPGDTDQGDGQGLSNATRKAQATALLNFVSQIQTASGDSDVMVLGDLNAYSEEDPIDLLRAGGLTKLTTSTESYVFQGQTGSLDYALVTSSLLEQVTGAAKWNINADEPITLDYNDDIVTSGEASAEDRNDTSLYAPTPFRSSDHDPVLVGLNLQPSNRPPVANSDTATTNEDMAVTFNVLTNDTDANNDVLTVASFTTPTNGVLTNSAGSFTYTPNLNFNGSDSFTYTISDGKGGTASAPVTITINPVNDAPVNTVPGSQTAVQDSILVFSTANGNAIAISDVDANGGLEQVNLSVSNGFLNLSSTNGLTIVNGSNNSAAVTVQGTLGNLNSALNGLSFTPTAPSVIAGAATLTILTDDLGNTGAGGAKTDTDTVAIAINPANLIRSGASNSTIQGTAGADTIYAGAGNDIIFGNGGNDIILGEAGNDKIYVYGGNNSVYGGAGSDTIEVGAGINFIDGGIGNDTISLAGGQDTIVLARGNGNDTINNYNAGSTRFNLSAGLTFNDLTIVQDGSETSIRAGNEKLASLSRVQSSSVTASSFITA